MSYNQDLEWDCGADVDVPITLFSDEAGVTPLDLTGVTEIRYRLSKQTHRDWAVLLTKLFSDDGIELDGAADLGTIILHLTKGDTLVLDIDDEEVSRLTGIYEHELRVTDSFGNVTVLFTGRATINPTGPV